MYIVENQMIQIHKNKKEDILPLPRKNDQCALQKL